MCEHSGGVGGESFCWRCYQEKMGAAYCSQGERTAMADKFGCDNWTPAEPSPPMRWCYWCQGYRDARWPAARVSP